MAVSSTGSAHRPGRRPEDLYVRHHRSAAIATSSMSHKAQPAHDRLDVGPTHNLSVMSARGWRQLRRGRGLDVGTGRMRSHGWTKTSLRATPHSCTTCSTASSAPRRGVECSDDRAFQGRSPWLGRECGQREPRPAFLKAWDVFLNSAQEKKRHSYEAAISSLRRGSGQLVAVVPKISQTEADGPNLNLF